MPVITEDKNSFPSSFVNDPLAASFKLPPNPAPITVAKALIIADFKASAGFIPESMLTAKFKAACCAKYVAPVVANVVALKEVVPIVAASLAKSAPAPAFI
ncbi:MAG: hypothetical protein ACD_79C00247G0001 [uncultured bacterium]|nr:MAG: hypothetical protein ACD_79C00247G0001 [uncultured bacterium]